MSKPKPSKNGFRRQQKKLKRQEKPLAPSDTATAPAASSADGSLQGQTAITEDEDANSLAGKQSVTKSFTDTTPSFSIDDIPTTNAEFAEFSRIFKRFEESQEDIPRKPQQREQVIWEHDDIPEEDDEIAAALKASKKQRKRENKLSVAELKALARKPELVEWTDADSSDPRLLLAIKSQRNVVPVPSHWSLKREYLSSKRGIEKPPFRLPKFIADTGIAEMRDAALEKQAEQSLKQKQRERVQPKMGRLDIDYGKLYNAFFKFQTKPELTRFGEVYYEGKEFETNLKHLRPGEFSDELREALGMGPGFAPPWLLNMQRCGPPPGYPALRVPGVNAPPPPGSQWGYQPGQFGKPPVDDSGNPKWGGDLLGANPVRQMAAPEENIDKSTWGELVAVEEESEDEGEDEEEDESDQEEEEEGRASPSGLVTGMQTALPSDIGGLESVTGEFNLRKRRGFDTEQSSGSRQAFQVLEEQQVNISGFMGSDKRYNLKQAQADVPMLGSQDSRKRKAGDVDVSVDLDELQREGKVSKEEVARQYEAQRQDQTKQWTVDQDDLSQMIAEESRKRLKKDTRKREEKRGGRQ